MCGPASSLANAPLDGFTDEQKAYLGQLIQDLDLTAVFKPASSGGSQAPLTVHGTPVEDLSKEETFKLNRHPFDLWGAMQNYADQGQMPEGEDAFMVKHHGLFNVAPIQAGFMTRLRIAACKMRGDQMVGLGDLSEDVAGGYAHVTTRGNLQMREIPPGRMVDLLTGLAAIGLTSRGSGADSVRNITCNPTAGFDPQELMDLSPYAVKLHNYILNTPDLHGIPRKFNICYDGAGEISVVSDTNDIAYLATRVKADATDLPEGIEAGQVYCRVLLGGITGHLDFARDTGCLCTPEQTIDVSVAMLKVFIENGDRTNRKKARLKYLLDDWGFDKFIAAIEEKLGYSLPRVKLADCEERAPIERQKHIGVHDSKDGSVYLGIALPIGRMTPDQMRAVGQIALRYGRNDVRLTVWQNVIIPYVVKEDVDDVVAKLGKVGLSVQASSFAAGAVACTGRFGCKYASAHTKEHLTATVEYLQSRLELDQPINIHATGCTHSCAQHYIGDIGLLGASIGEGDEMQEAFQVFLGGGSDQDQGIAVQLCGPVAATELPIFLEHVLRRYLAERQSSETFLAFTRRHTEDQLKSLFLTDAPAALTEVA